MGEVKIPLIVNWLVSIKIAVKKTIIVIIIYGYMMGL